MADVAAKAKYVYEQHLRLVQDLSEEKAKLAQLYFDLQQLKEQLYVFLTYTY